MCEFSIPERGEQEALDGAALQRMQNTSSIPHKFRSRSAGNPGSYSPVYTFHREGNERVTEEPSSQDDIVPALSAVPSSKPELSGVRLSSRVDGPNQRPLEATSIGTLSSSTTTFVNTSNHSWSQPYARQSGFTAPVPEAPAIVINHPNTRQVRQNWVSYFLGHLSIISRTSKLVLFFRVAFIILPVVCSIFVLFLTWNEFCDYPIQTYLLIDVFRALVILPTVVYLHLTPEARRRRTPDEISHRWIERIKQYTDIFACCWFIMGNWWTFSSKSCSVPLHSMSLAVIVLGYLHLFIPLIVCGAIIFCLPCVLIATRFLHMGNRTGGTSNGLGAPEELIRRIPIVSYSHNVEKTNYADAVRWRWSAVSSSEDVDIGDPSKANWSQDNEQPDVSDTDAKQLNVEAPPPIGSLSPAALAFGENLAGEPLASNRGVGTDPKQVRRTPPPRPPKPSPLSASSMRLESESFSESKRFGYSRGSLKDDTSRLDTDTPHHGSQTIAQSTNKHHFMSARRTL
ncbi:hypothetical protein BJ742DRAFT_306369 [Cladochytrium replicatum]|nr:hypothetical protein BJ742DRAFT_306369 [Cladochytrium replicatum]